MSRPCSFKNNISTEKILRGFWSPFEPEFYPFAEVEEFCNPCFRWHYIELLRGSNKRWGFLFKNPNNYSEDFPQYYNFADTFRKFCVVLLKGISRSTHPNSILRSLRQPDVLLDFLRGNADLQDYHLNAIEYVTRWLERLQTNGILRNYLSNTDSLFDLQIVNENLDLFRQNSSRITLTQNTQSGIGTNRRTSNQTFSWRGDISIYGIIPIIHLESQEIRAPVPIADNFFDPPLNLSNINNTPAGIRLLLVEKEFHKMWILRESLAQLIDNQRLQPQLFDDASGDEIFNSYYDLNSYNFRDFDIIVDTIDHSITMNPNRSFRDETGQAAIIYDLLYRNYPGVVNTFQDCPIRIGQTPGNRYLCPMGDTMGCGMSDRRIANLQFPRDRVETNIYRFLRLLRDEAVFKHEILYKLTRLYPDRLTDLNNYSVFWYGDLFQDQSQRWIFRSTMPNYWEVPQISDKMYEVCLISPLCYEKGLEITFTSRINQNEYVITPNITFNPWIQNNPFITGNTIRCLIGQFSVEENLFNIKRQKNQLVKAIHYSRRSLTQANTIQMQGEILERRLAQRHRRIGEATFGRFARYV